MFFSYIPRVIAVEYETPELTVLTPAIHAIQGFKEDLLASLDEVR